MPRVRIQYSYPKPQLGLLWTRWISLALGSMCLIWTGAVWMEQRVAQADDQAIFLQTMEPVQQVHSRPASSPAIQTARSIPLAQLEIPRVHVSAFVEDGFDGRTLGRAIGHAPRSAKPGENGNIVLAGHRDTFFAGLESVRNGDIVRLRAPGGKQYDYEITRIFVVGPDDNWVMNSSTGRSELTLITCYPFHFVGSAPRRFVVQAQPVTASKEML